VFRITKDDGKIEQIKKPTNSLVRKTAVEMVWHSPTKTNWCVAAIPYV
jgi:hypothetical protein